MKRIGILLLFTILVGLTPATAAETVSRIAAVVNDDIITTHALDQTLKARLVKMEKRPSPAQLSSLRQELLQRMIEETLVQQRIRALNLTVSEDEIEAAMQDVQKQNNLTREELKDAVLVQGMTFDVYYDNLRKQILRYKLISEDVRSKVDVSDREVLEYYRAHLDDYRFSPKVTLSAVSFPINEKATTADKEVVRLAAKEALVKLRQGQDLEAVATEYEQTFDSRGGSIGTFAHGDLIPEFVTALETVEQGDFSEPVETTNAIHLLRLDEQIKGGLQQFDLVKVGIYQTIMDQKTDARIREWTKGLERKAFIDIRL